jgi:hypothetical protein
MPETPEIPEELLPAEVADAKPSAPEIAATEGVAEIHENEKEETPVLDVHPAHHAASTWKEFFIHIATIVLGLIIAVGLEQLVERIHQRYELSEKRSRVSSKPTTTPCRESPATGAGRLPNWKMTSPS